MVIIFAVLEDPKSHIDGIWANKPFQKCKLDGAEEVNGSASVGAFIIFS
jgi:hypothetical protein|tara:strand:+ start:451 stop:597 length:147 start_codon:yes stop_codon:yes gene_type:complete